jgi:hypothetical protein
MLLQVAAGTRRRDDTAALNITYTASVAAVDAITPRANHGSICHTVVYLASRFRSASFSGSLRDSKSLRPVIWVWMYPGIPEKCRGCFWIYSPVNLRSGYDRNWASTTNRDSISG